MKHPQILAAIMLVAVPLAMGFTVVKNVNSPEPPKERLVIFDRAKGHEQIVLKDLAQGSAMGFAEDGAIEAKTSGNAAVEATVYWNATDAVPDTFDGTKYNFLLVTMKVEGDIIRKHDNGKTSSSRPGNLWMAIRLLDADGNRCGQENIASLTEDQTTPAEMTTVKIPLMLVTGGNGADSTKIKGIGFYWSKTHDYNDRQCRIVIDRIALAD